MRAGLLSGFLFLLTVTQPVFGQRLLEEWRVRTSAGPDALARGATAVFWNPAQLLIELGRGEVVVLDLHAPRVTGINGLAAAAAIVVPDGRTTFGIGYEHMSVSGVERTTTSPDGGETLQLAEDRFGLAVARVLNTHTRVGAVVQYTRLPVLDLDSVQSVIALGAGFRYQPTTRLPLYLAGMAATEGDGAYWMAGLEFASPWQLPDWALRAEYGAAGGQLAPGVTHRVALTGEWQRAAELSVGAAIEPDGNSRSITPVGAATLRFNRYRLGIVREQLPNDFGGAYSFRFSVSF